MGYLRSVWSRLQPEQLVGPALEQARSYQRAWLGRDVLTAVTILAVIVPQALAYGELAGLPPVAGLYAALLPLLLYPIFASSRQLMVGPESGLAILTATALAPLALAQTSRYAALAAMLAVLVGVFMIVGGVLKLGLLADFLSRPVLIGFMNGVAVILIASQLPRLFGIPVRSESTLGKIWGVITNLNRTSWRTLVLGLVLIAVLALMSRLGPKVPGALVALLLAGAAVVVLDLDQKGVSVIGTVPKGLPELTYPHVGLADFGSLLPLAAGLALVGFSEAILTARAFAEKHGETVDANHELIAMGIGNVGVGFTQGFPTSASQSRTAVADGSRMRTQLAQMLAAVLVGVFLLFFTGILKNVPQVALASIVIYAALGLIEERQLRALYGIDRTEFGLAIATFAGVVVFGIMTGILVAVGLSLAVFLGGVVRPHDAVLGSVHGVDGFNEAGGGRDTEAAPGVIVYRFDGPLFFANADYFLTRSLALIEGRPLRCFVLGPRGRDHDRRHRGAGGREAARRGARAWRLVPRRAGDAPAAAAAARRAARRCDRRGELPSDDPHRGRGGDVVTAWTLAIVAGALLVYASVSKRLAGTIITSAMVFVGMGLIVGPEALDRLDAPPTGHSVRLLAEATLALVLFADASRIDLRALRREYSVPARLLGIGLPLTIVAGAVAAWALFPSLTFVEAIVVGILLAPTDAALGQAVVTLPALPSRIRQGLNVESGLNDGICVPLLLIALAAAEAQAEVATHSHATTLVVEQIGYGILGGVIAGAVAAAIVVFAGRRRLIAEPWLQIIPVAAAALAYGIASPLGGSGFIAAFVGGMVFGGLRRRGEAEDTFLLDQTGGLLDAVTFLFFGAVLLGPSLGHLSWQVVLYARAEPDRGADGPRRALDVGDARAAADRRRSSAGSARAGSPRSCSR